MSTTSPLPLSHFLTRLALFAAIFSLFSLLAPKSTAAPYILPPENALRSDELGLVINDNDPLSIQVGNYYQQRRKIPDANVVHLRFSTKSPEISPGEFAVQKKILDKRLPKHIQALALSWATPYRIGCMSITSAFAFGYDDRFCAIGCKVTAISDYFRSDNRTPFNSFNIRPTMMIAATGFREATALIERGISSDGLVPNGSAYLVETSDTARSVRKAFFGEARKLFGDQISVQLLRVDALQNADDVMFYFTGMARVAEIETNRFLPGAVADHLTSFGGRLTDSSQMSALRWLEAGATGSYGTVVEPCAFTTKFPNPTLLMKHYLSGETLIEAYWKSVAMPGQGVFIGEPLARPYGGYRVQERSGRWYVEGTALRPGSYTLLGADKIEGPFEHIASGLQVNALTRSLELPSPLRKFYKLHYIDMGINLVPTTP